MRSGNRLGSLASALFVGVFGIGGMAGIGGCGAPQEQDLDQAAQLHRGESDWDDEEDWGEKGDWPMYNHDPSGSRWNRDERRLDRRSVADLQVKWSFPTPGAVTGTPVVADDTIYFGEGGLIGTGHFYAFSRSGTLRWQIQVPAGVTSSALVRKDLVIFGDQDGLIYGVDRRNGAVRWQVRPNPHPSTAIYGSPTPVGKYVAIGTSSNESVIEASDPNYPCCSFRGSMVLLDPRDGSIKWQTYTITEAESRGGASGASVWGTPTYDADTRTIYFGTSNNYNEPTSSMSDSVIALDARNGRIRWVNQRTPGDDWNIRFPFNDDHPDVDIGDSPQIYKIRGRKVVGAGQKSGFYHVLDAATGVAINQIQVEPSGNLGGLFADSALADGVVYANGTNWPDFYNQPPISGDIIAISGEGTRELWRFSTPGSPNISGVAVAAGVVYFQSFFDGGLYALDSRNGALLKRVTVGSGGSSGPSVSGGQVFVGTGNALVLPSTPGSLVALGR